MPHRESKSVFIDCALPLRRDVDASSPTRFESDYRRVNEQSGYCGKRNPSHTEPVDRRDNMYKGSELHRRCGVIAYPEVGERFLPRPVITKFQFQFSFSLFLLSFQLKSAQPFKHKV